MECEGLFQEVVAKLLCTVHYSQAVSLDDTIVSLRWSEGTANVGSDMPFLFQ